MNVEAAAHDEAVDEDEIETGGEDARVLAWRLKQFSRQGFDADAVCLLSEAHDVSHHDTRRLIAGGCPLECVLRIVL